MTIKLILIKSGEDLIADVTEMAIGEEDNRRVIGYYLNRPCVVKMSRPTPIPEVENGTSKRAGFEISLFPWMPLSVEETIPIPSDWLITLTEPVPKLKNMYIEDVVNHGKDNQDSDSDEQSDTDQSD